MKIVDTKQNTTQTIAFSGNVTELLQQININPETVVVAVNGQLVGDDHAVTDEDTVTLYSVISGG